MIFDIEAPKNGKPKNGYPSFCWQCGKQLNWLRGGSVAFEIVRDPGGAEHRVHGACVDEAVGDGVAVVERGNNREGA